MTQTDKKPVPPDLPIEAGIFMLGAPICEMTLPSFQRTME